MGDSFTNAILLTESSLVSWTTSTSVRNVYFKFNVVAGIEYEVTTFSQGDLYGHLYNTEKVEIATDDDAGAGFNPLIKFTATETGVMYFMVRSSNNYSTPTFQAQFKLSIPNVGISLISSISLKDGDVYKGVIMRASYDRYFALKLEIGSVYRFKVEIAGNRPQMWLYRGSRPTTETYRYAYDGMNFKQIETNMYMLVRPMSLPPAGEAQSYTVTLEKIPLESIEIVRGGGLIYENETLVLDYILKPSDLSYQQYNLTIKSSDSSVVEIPEYGSVNTISDEFEMLGVGAGVATIDVFDPGGNKITSFDITVAPPYPYEHGEGTPENPFLVSNIDELAGVHSRLTSHFRQVADIDLSGVNWIPISMSYSGHTENYFGGSYDGDNFKITNLTINMPEIDGCGLFAETSDVHFTTFKNINIVNPQIACDDGAGALIGRLDSDAYLIENCHVIGGSVKAEADAGGLVGSDWSWIYNKGDSKTINCSTSCDVTSTYSNAGGLFAECTESSIIENCYSTGKISGDGYVGGLIGFTYSEVSIINCYATGSVHPGSEYPYYAHGGLIGYLDDESELINCYSVGYVEKHEDYESGGLIGEIYEPVYISSCYYDTETSGHSDTDRGTPLSTEEMKKRASFVDWDFDSIWTINEGLDYPKFISFIKCIAFPITLLR